ncbi:hypothetical protein DID75_02095 [Candidatus Marinamargulisbacteria bacterium SCGC AG-410-N11]|nr:hypothetical protein DID75_02095 [Candidatus Marinamargulisbacteria bacterium SCGC AG-410-N11]
MKKQISLKNNQKISLLTKIILNHNLQQTIETLKKLLHSEKNDSHSLSQNIKAKPLINIIKPDKQLNNSLFTNSKTYVSL